MTDDLLDSAKTTDTACTYQLAISVAKIADDTRDDCGMFVVNFSAWPLPEAAARELAEGLRTIINARMAGLHRDISPLTDVVRQ